MAADDNHAFGLRLLAHPVTGIAGMSDEERRQIIAAARHIDGLVDRLSALEQERDYWQRLAANV